MLESLAVVIESLDMKNSIFDSLIDGRLLHTFNVLDDQSPEGLCIEIDLPLPAARVIRSLDRVIDWH